MIDGIRRRIYKSAYWVGQDLGNTDCDVPGSEAGRIYPYQHHQLGDQYSLLFYTAKSGDKKVAAEKRESLGKKRTCYL